MPSGYEEIYLKLIPRLTDCDFVESAERLGLKLTKEDKISINFLCREYLISKEGAVPVDGKPVDVNNRSILLYYVLSKGRGNPKNAYMPLFRMAETPIAWDSQKQSIMNAPLIREFGNDYEKFSETAIKLGGRCIDESNSGKHEWLFELLPKIPVKIIFYEADEEFEAEAQILLDEGALYFFDFECLAFLIGCLVRALVKTAQYGDVVGWE